MTDRNTADKLAEAKSILFRQGWHQRSYVKNYTDYKTSPVCLMGALYMTVWGKPWPGGTAMARVRPLMAAVAKQIPPGRLIDDWNDDPATTLTDVCGVLDAAIRDCNA